MHSNCQLRLTVARIRALGKRVVVVAPPLSSDVEIGECIERLTNGVLTFGASTCDCRISLAEYHHQRKVVLEFLVRLPVEAAVALVSFDTLLCDELFCDTKVGRAFVHHDAGHFSYDGAREVGRRMHLADVLNGMAK